LGIDEVFLRFAVLALLDKSPGKPCPIVGIDEPLSFVEYFY